MNLYLYSSTLLRSILGTTRVDPSPSRSRGGKKPRILEKPLPHPLLVYATKPNTTSKMKPSTMRALSRRINSLIESRSPLSTSSQCLRSATPVTNNPSNLRPRPRLPQPRTATPAQQTRPFLSSILPSGGRNNNEPKDRVLTATRTLPYAPASLFRVISSVESYADFLPFLSASTVTHRDPQTGYPTRAFLTVGYGPISETFTSKVDCDESRWVVEARSGAKFGVDSKDGQSPTEITQGQSQGQSGGLFGGIFPGANEGIFEYLSTRWELVPEAGEQRQTTVRLRIEFEFKSQLHAAMMKAVEHQMATAMIDAFEQRIREVERW
ncbi:ubiquinone-binding COQ10-like protein [Aspergillus melleus]|uniref:ubiquinone-binding COQ10-like protein n=1 Tax=Aspergillus melleus TaxID=138277 RepID=UPI001E8C9EDC|nr:Coenzyme Q-binding protein coq10, mitochondrial [Aspergillus melleus]KAH8423066.1 Coenzyme Q-binding protein coq10, mitochondrial [Aspergillus melleus]